ncbi:MAG: signal peptide peptidase SppA [Desulfobacteraceae bacterium]
MFSRRHPFLFFTLILSSIFAVFLLCLMLMITSGLFFFQEKLGSKDALQGKGNVGVIEVSGIISSSMDTVKTIKRMRENNQIKALVIRVNSPGGGVGPSQEIYRELIKTKREKIVIASLGSVAASGGYYIASAADKIVANPGTITGSIGVIMEYANIEKIVEKIGLTPVVIKSGEYKDIASPLREITDKERGILQKVVDELHRQFISDAANGRGMDPKKVSELADGRIYTGKQALDLKLIDQLGNFEDSLSLAGNLAGIKGEIKPVYPREDRITFIKRLTRSLFKDFNISGPVSDNFRYIAD